MSSAHLEAEAKERQREAGIEFGRGMNQDGKVGQKVAQAINKPDERSAVQAAKMLNHYSTCPYSMSGSIEVA